METVDAGCMFLNCGGCSPLASSILRPHLSTLFLDLHTSLMPYTTAAFRWRFQSGSPACMLMAARYQLHNSIQHHHPTQAEHASPQHPTHSAPLLQQTHRPRREASGLAPSGALLLFFPAPSARCSPRGSRCSREDEERGREDLQLCRSQEENDQRLLEGWGILQSPHLLFISRLISLWIQHDWLSSTLRGL